MNFFKQLWVEILAVVLFIISIVLLALGGFTKADISPIFEAVFAVLDVVSLLILAIKKTTAKERHGKQVNYYSKVSLSLARI